MSCFPSANNVLPGSLEDRSDKVDDAPRQVQMDDGTKGDRVALPKTQEPFEAPVITIQEDEDEEEEEVGEEKEDDYQLDAVCPSPLKTNASGVSKGARDVSSVGFTGKLNAAISG